MAFLGLLIGFDPNAAADDGAIDAGAGPDHAAAAHADAEAALVAGAALPRRGRKRGHEVSAETKEKLKIKQLSSRCLVI